jgi:hypothetical protein
MDNSNSDEFLSQLQRHKILRDYVRLMILQRYLPNRPKQLVPEHFRLILFR